MARDSFLLSRGARRLRLPLLALAAVTLYRGHHEPGGGFIAALLAAAAFALLALGDGVPAARRALRVDPLTLAALGLGVALAAGIPGLLIHDAFLAGVWLPPLGSVKLGTPLLFDLGVFFTVLGFATKTVFALLEESP